MDPASDHAASAPETRHAPGPFPGTPRALRREILERLRRDGPASPDQLATAIGASRTGVLQQLRSLESTHFVSRETVRHGVGRPRHLYDVTADAQQLFPSNYDGLAAGLLAAIGAVGGEVLIEQVFQARRRQIGDRVRRQLDDRVGPGAPFIDRVRELAVIQDELGYLANAEVDFDGTIRLREHNCAILDVARGERSACEAELDLFRDVLGADVVRETHIASGDRCCSYRIVERTSGEWPRGARPSSEARVSEGPPSG
jgi:predicted ArsR family transcriptional regulator